MPTLFPDIYVPKLKETDIAIAARTGILHDHSAIIAEQLKDFVRLGLQATFFHNLPPNPKNNRIVSQVWDIWGISLVRLSDHENFYASSIQRHSSPAPTENKLIFMERNYLEKPNGKRLNLISVWGKNSQGGDALEKVVQNTGFRADVALMCAAVEARQISRIHILKATKRGTLKDELLSLEGSGTLIENNFEPVIHPANEWDIEVIFNLFQSQKHSGQLKPRDRTYVQAHFARFIVAEVDGIPVWCAETIPIDGTTVELGWIVVNSHFMDFKVGKLLIEKFEKNAQDAHKNIISVTGNQKLAGIFSQRWYDRGEGVFPERAKESPTKMLFFKKW